MFSRHQEEQTNKRKKFRNTEHVVSQMEVVSRKTQKENNVVSRRCRLLYRVFVVRLHWSTEKHAPSCHAGIFLRVMNSQIVYLSFFYTFGVKCLHTILAKKRAFLRLILIFEISHPHTLTQKKFSHTIHWSVSQRTELQGQGGSRNFFGRGCTRLWLYFNTNKPHSFFFAEYQLYWNRRSSQGVGCALSNWIEGNAIACEQAQLPGAPGELARSQARNAMKAKFSALNKK